MVVIKSIEQVHYNRLLQRARIDDPNDGQTMQHEEMLATIVPDIKDTGFNTVALFFMLFLFVIFFFYFGFELILLPLLSSIDDALVHIYNLGRYGIVITVFLLTYKVFTTSNIGFKSATDL